MPRVGLPYRRRRTVSKRLLLDVAPTGVRHEVEIDADGNGFTAIEHTPGRVESEILDGCAQLRSLHQRRGALLQHAARVPINTYNAWKREWRESGAYKTVSWSQFEISKLNSRDWCKMRTGRKGDSVFGKRL